MTVARKPRHTLRAEKLGLAYDGRTIISDLDLTIPDGRESP